MSVLAVFFFFRYGQVECLRLLLKRGAQFRQDDEKKTPVDLCVEVRRKLAGVLFAISKSTYVCHYEKKIPDEWQA